MATAAAVASLVLGVLGKKHRLSHETTYVASLRVVVFPALALFTRSNHTKTRRSSTLILSVLPLYIIAQLLRLRTAFDVQGNTLTTRDISLIVLMGISFVSLLLECKGPERTGDLEDRESPYVTANIYSRSVLLDFAINLRSRVLTEVSRIPG